MNHTGVFGTGPSKEIVSEVSAAGAAGASSSSSSSTTTAAAAAAAAGNRGSTYSSETTLKHSLGSVPEQASGAVGGLEGKSFLALNVSVDQILFSIKCKCGSDPF